MLLLALLLSSFPNTNINDSARLEFIGVIHIFFFAFFEDWAKKKRILTIDLIQEKQL
jgi:hypothetical protein